MINTALFAAALVANLGVAKGHDCYVSSAASLRLNGAEMVPVTESEMKLEFRLVETESGLWQIQSDGDEFRCSHPELLATSLRGELLSASVTDELYCTGGGDLRINLISGIWVEVRRLDALEVPTDGDDLVSVSAGWCILDQ